MKPIIFHIDVNSAYLSWTALELLKENPDAADIRTIPAIVGGDRSTRHGIVLAKSQLAKKQYRIQTAEPIAQALRKCPSLTIVPPNHALYAARSRELMDFLQTITPDLEQVSIDECFLDFTGIAHRYASPQEAAAFIRASVLERFGYTVNVGISSSRVLAKMASDFEKPNKTHTLWPSELQEKLWPLPIERLFMAGHSSVAVLKKLEIRTIGDLARSDPALISLHLKSHGKMLWEYANGLDDTPVASGPSDLKGIGNSVTLASDVTSAPAAKKILHSLAEKVAERLRADGKCASGICVEIKYSDFTRVSHQTLLNAPTQTTEVIYRTSCQLFDALWSQAPIRLLGIRTGKLASPDAPVQLSFFDLQSPKSQKQQQLDEALDKIRSRYGRDSIRRGF